MVHDVIVSIVILTYNRFELLDKLLVLFKAIKYEKVEIIVVDNHSEDDTKNLAELRHPECIFIRTEENIGVEARNLGLKQAKGDIIICLDDDVFGIDDVAIAKIVGIFKNNEKLGAINFKVLDGFTGKQCNWVHHCKIEEFADLSFNTYEITEGAVAFRRSALIISGFYPENFFIGHEGPDLAIRLIDNGFDVIYTSEISVKHFHSELGRKSWFKYYYETRNQYWIAARNFTFLYSLKYLLIGQISMLLYSIRDGFFEYWLRAVRDGIKGLPRALSERKVVSASTRNVIRVIDENRPSLPYMIRKKLFNKTIRL